MDKILIYTDNSSERLSYIVSEFEKLLGVNISQTKNQDVFNNFKGAKLWYSIKQIEGAFSIHAHPLLFQSDIKPLNIEVNKKEIPVFFEGKGFFAFDIFAASFYLMSRYEEYLPSSKDLHGRYLAHNSLAKQHGFLEKPIINIWVEYFKSELLKFYPKLTFSAPKTETHITIDVDQAYAFKHKPLTHLLLSSLNNSIKGYFGKQIAVMSGKMSDPYDQFEFINNQARQNKLKLAYFIHVGKKGKNDPANPSKNAFKSLLQKISFSTTIGLHPSYRSNHSTKTLKKELLFLSTLLNKSVTSSRQHFIQLSLPFTYQNLLSVGIHKDFSMGYPDHLGFRAGISSPFKWFDLQKNKATKLSVHPFWLMDIHIKRGYCSIQDALDKIYELKSQNLSNDIIFHSHFFALDGQLEGSKAMFVKILKACRSED